MRTARGGVSERLLIGGHVGVELHVAATPAVYKKKHDATPQPTEASTAISEPSAASATTCFVRAPCPREIARRGMLAPSMIAHLLVQKYPTGMPFHRLEQQFAREGFSLDRGTMARYAEEIGAVLGFIVEAARRETIANAFCLSTDATGVSIQPEPLDDGRRQTCRKGHFFVVLADRDHIFFDYQAKHWPHRRPTPPRRANLQCHAQREPGVDEPHEIDARSKPDSQCPQMCFTG